MIRCENYIINNSPYLELEVTQSLSMKKLILLEVQVIMEMNMRKSMEMEQLTMHVSNFENIFSYRCLMIDNVNSQ